MDLPASMLRNIIAHLMEMDGGDEVRISISSLNVTERRVSLRTHVDGELLVLRTVDVDDDATDAPDEPASNEDYVRGRPNDN